MKEQDALLSSTAPKILMSIETYEQMQRDPRVAESICNRIQAKVNKGSMDDAIEYLKKW